MEHVRQIELIQLVANELADPRRAEVERHLAECSACQALFGQQAALWRTLGQWSPEFAERELFTGIEQRLGIAPHGVWSNVVRVSRVAAAIIIGVGAGYGVARYWQPVKASQPAVASTENELAATEAFGLQYFEDVSPAGLYAALQDMPADFETEEGAS